MGYEHVYTYVSHPDSGQPGPPMTGPARSPHLLAVPHSSSPSPLQYESDFEDEDADEGQIHQRMQLVSSMEGG